MILSNLCILLSKYDNEFELTLKRPYVLFTLPTNTPYVPLCMSKWISFRQKQYLRSNPHGRLPDTNYRNPKEAIVKVQNKIQIVSKEKIRICLPATFKLHRSSTCIISAWVNCWYTSIISPSNNHNNRIASLIVVKMDSAAVCWLAHIYESAVVIPNGYCLS